MGLAGLLAGVPEAQGWWPSAEGAPRVTKGLHYIFPMLLLTGRPSYLRSWGTQAQAVRESPAPARAGFSGKKNHTSQGSRARAALPSPALGPHGRPIRSKPHGTQVAETLTAKLAAGLPSQNANPTQPSRRLEISTLRAGVSGWSSVLR